MHKFGYNGTIYSGLYNGLCHITCCEAIIVSEYRSIKTAVEAVAFMKKLIDDYWNKLISEADYNNTVKDVFTSPETRKFFLRRDIFTPSAERIGKRRLEELKRALNSLGVL